MLCLLQLFRTACFFLTNTPRTKLNNENNTRSITDFALKWEEGELDCGEKSKLGLSKQQPLSNAVCRDKRVEDMASVKSQRHSLSLVLWARES